MSQLKTLYKESRNYKKLLRIVFNPWSIVSIIIALGILMPLLFIAGSLFSDSEGAYIFHNKHIVYYITNSLILIVGVSIFTLVAGSVSAWLVTAYEFPGRGFFEWSLALPLAVPCYVAGYAYSFLLDFNTPLLLFVRKYFGLEFQKFVDTSFVYILIIFVLGSTLYPYVYLYARSSFARCSKVYLENSRILGAGHFRTFFKIILPISRPVLFTGTTLVIMEVLNDYGTVQFFNIPTLSSGIFRMWYDHENINLAMKFSFFVMIFILGFIYLEYYIRRKKKYWASAKESGPINRYKISKFKSYIVSFLCFMPFLFGFILPIIILAHWSYQSINANFDFKVIYLTLKTIGITLIFTGIILFITLIISYTGRIHKSIFTSTLTKLSLLGYALPGVIIAVGVMYFVGKLDDYLADIKFGTYNLFLSSSYFALVYAYFVRFFGVAFNPIDSNLKQINIALDESAKTLGRKPFYIFFTIHIPLLKIPILAALTLLFMDLIKELPITYALHPANYETLAIHTFELAQSGRIPECAIPALILIFIGVICTLIFRKILLPRIN